MPPEHNWPHLTSFQRAYELLKYRQIVSLTGIRRTGKTSILKQIIGELIIDKKIDPKGICYYLFEESLELNTRDNLKEVIDVYLSRILKTSLRDLSQPVYIFLDEIQYIDHWQGVLKYYYDLSPNIKFFISGSASLFIKKRTVESLAGRIFEETSHPLTFREFLMIKGSDLSKHPLFSIIDNLFELEPHHIKELQLHIAGLADIFEEEYKQFLTHGQFPELVDITDPLRWMKYIKDSILAKALEYDIPRLFDIDKTEELKHFYKILAHETGNLIEYKNLASETGISLPTLVKYHDCFKQCFLASLIYNYSRKIRRTPKQLKKGYVSSPNFTAAIVGLTPETIHLSRFTGYLVETVAYQHLSKITEDISFWREREKEVDFIVKLSQKIVPVEVKYSEHIREGDYKTLIHVMNRLRCESSIILTKKTVDVVTLPQGRTIYLLPVWLLL